MSILIGTLAQNFPGTKFGPLYSQKVDNFRTLGLKKAKTNLDVFTKLTKEAILNLQWWIKILFTVSRKLQYPDDTKVIQLFTLVGKGIL